MTLNTEAEYDAAVAEADLLTGRSRSPEEDARLHILFDVIEQYEDVHYYAGVLMLDVEDTWEDWIPAQPEAPLHE